MGNVSKISIHNLQHTELIILLCP